MVKKKRQSISSGFLKIGEIRQKREKIGLFKLSNREFNILIKYESKKLQKEVVPSFFTVWDSVDEFVQLRENNNR